MRRLFAAALLCLVSAGAEAKQSPYPVTPFEGDRYGARQAQMGADVVRAVQAKRHRDKYRFSPRNDSSAARQRGEQGNQLNNREYYRKNKHLKSYSGRNKGWRKSPIPIPAPRQVPIFAPLAEPLAAPPSLGEGFRRVAAQILGGRPSGCPARAWCGCYLAKLLGMARRDLWLARNWAYVGSHISHPVLGAIVVWRHHVGTITAVAGNRIRVLSGNDGRAVRDRWRSTAGVIAYRSPS